MLNICYLCGEEFPIRKYHCKKCGRIKEQCDACREVSKGIAFVCFWCHEGVKKGDELK